ncbi:MAG: hypothetical protein ACM3XM_15550 [Mycobacterium leprae]
MMVATERRTLERAMHDVFLVVRSSPADMGSRPLTGSFVTPDLTVGPDGHPRVLVWNLGTREASGVIAEFASVPAGSGVSADHVQFIGRSVPGIIPARSSVTLNCQSIWPRATTGDVLLVSVSQPEQDPVKTPWDAMNDRHVGQMNYAWGGQYAGAWQDPTGTRLFLEVRPANKGLFRVKVYVSVGGRLPSNPQPDRIMAPNGQQFRWLETTATRKELWELIALDNRRLTIRRQTRFLDEPGRTEEQVVGTLERK